jgi:hypothetical protein
MREITLKNFVTFDDESQSYYKLYGDLYFSVPHFVKKYIIDDEKIQVWYASGSYAGIWKNGGIK